MKRDRVLVVDDDPDFRELLSMYLVDWGFICVEAANGPAALPLIERERGRLRAVLLDYYMPGMEPRECAKAVLARVEPEVPVILVSAAVDIAERASELGLQRFLAKPFEMSDLQVVLSAPV